MRSLRALLDRALRSLARVGADPSDDEDTRLRKTLLVPRARPDAEARAGVLLSGTRKG